MKDKMLKPSVNVEGRTLIPQRFWSANPRNPPYPVLGPPPLQAFPPFITPEHEYPATRPIRPVPRCYGLPTYQQRFPSPFVGWPRKVYHPGFPVIEHTPNPAFIPPYFGRPIPSNNLCPPKVSAKPNKDSAKTKEKVAEEKHADKNEDEDEKYPEDEVSLSDCEKPAREKRMGTCAYKKRNVYKSIVRHMFGYMRKYREEMIAFLKEKGYKSQEIEHAFFKVNCYNDMERQKGNPKKSQTIIKKIVKKKCIYTHLLKRTLEYMVKTWEEGRLGKVSIANRGIYKEVCTRYYNEALRVLGEENSPASGNQGL